MDNYKFVTSVFLWHGLEEHPLNGDDSGLYPALQQGPSLLPEAPHAYGIVSRPTLENVCVCGNTWTSDLCSVYSSPWSLALCIAMLRGHLHTWIKDQSCFYLPLKPASGTRSRQPPVCKSISQVKHLEALSIHPSIPSLHFILICASFSIHPFLQFSSSLLSSKHKQSTRHTLLNGPWEPSVYSFFHFYERSTPVLLLNNPTIHLSAIKVGSGW